MSDSDRVRYFSINVTVNETTGALRRVWLSVWCHGKACGSEVVVAPGLKVWIDDKGRAFQFFITKPIGPADLDAVPKLDAKSRRFVERVIPRGFWNGGDS